MIVDVDLGHSLPEIMFVIFPIIKLLFFPLFLYFYLWTKISVHCPYFMSRELHFPSFRVENLNKHFCMEG